MFLPFPGLFTFVVSAVFTAAERPCSNHAEDPEEKKAVGDKKIIDKISDIKEFASGKETYYACQHEQGTEYTADPSEPVNNVRQFHKIGFCLFSNVMKIM